MTWGERKEIWGGIRTDEREKKKIKEKGKIEKEKIREKKKIIRINTWC
jgi:hypothetical protein